MPAIIGWPIRSDVDSYVTPVFSSPSWTLPVARLQDGDIQYVSQTASVLAANTTFDVDMGESVNISLIGLFNHNLTVNATIRLRSSTVSNFSSVAYDSTAVLAWSGGYTPRTLQGTTPGYIHMPSSTPSARYWRCDIVDTANPAGHIRIGRAAFCDSFTPGRGAIYGASHGFETSTTVRETDGSSKNYNRKPTRRVWKFATEHYGDSAMFGPSYDIKMQAGIHGQCVFVYSYPDTYMMKRSMLAVPRELSPFEYVSYNKNTTNWGFEEVL